MKSTYQLIGLFWDGKPKAEDVGSILPYDQSYLPLSHPLCLFDCVEKKRRVYATELFGVDTQADFDALVEELKGYDSVAAIIDYCPGTQMRTHRRFFMHRMCQAIESLSNALPESEVVAMKSRETRAVA